MLEQTFKDLPKYLKSFSETAMIIGRDVGESAWSLKADIERRIAEMTSGKTDDTTKSRRDASE